MSYGEEQLYADEYRNDYLKAQAAAMLTLAVVKERKHENLDTQTAEHQVEDIYEHFALPLINDSV